MAGVVVIAVLDIENPGMLPVCDGVVANPKIFFMGAVVDACVGVDLNRAADLLVASFDVDVVEPKSLNIEVVDFDKLPNNGAEEANENEDDTVAGWFVNDPRTLGSDTTFIALLATGASLKLIPDFARGTTDCLMVATDVLLANEELLLIMVG